MFFLPRLRFVHRGGLIKNLIVKTSTRIIKQDCRLCDLYPCTNCCFPSRINSKLYELSLYSFSVPVYFL